MKYVSTRGGAPILNFEDVLLTGLAADGGLYVPEQLPAWSHEEIASWRGLSYPELAHRIILPFVEDCIPAVDLTKLLQAAYSDFRHDAIAPLVQLDTNQWVLELFHGPTLAFKDFALQLLGHLLDYVLERRQKKIVIMGATSGDTGSAAIEGCRRCRNVDIFILHPHKRVSDVQRRQMTTVTGDNIHNLAIEGNFDDCQAMVKASFGDTSFLDSDSNLVAVNSINWARIMAQIVYYFYASLALGGPDREVTFSVPTGNFGDIFAGYLAKGMGLPIAKLIIATNRNDVLHRVMTQDRYARQEIHHSLSPSMDISVSSNFERLLFDLYDRDGTAIAKLMNDFSQGDIAFSAAAMERARALFESQRVDDEATLAEIDRTYAQSSYVLDPHSAIGVKAARDSQSDPSTPMVTLATAHPAKFPQAVTQSGSVPEPGLPSHMSGLMEWEERYTVLPNELCAVQQFMATVLER